jgi:two-component sensor histidine kinase
MLLEMKTPSPTRALTLRRFLPPTIARMACEQHLSHCPVHALEEALIREQALLREKDALLAEQELLRSESDHRLLNGLQLVVSLLSLQSRAAAAPEIAAQLSIAANRVATIERVHRRLHYNDGTRTVMMKKYLQDFCADFSSMTSSCAGQTLQVVGSEIEVSTATAIPLGFIANELVTNGHHILAVSNDGDALPADYDPKISKGLGMKIVGALVKKIGGDFAFGLGENNQGARFTVQFD